MIYTSINAKPIDFSRIRPLDNQDLTVLQKIVGYMTIRTHDDHVERTNIHCNTSEIA